MSYLLHTDRKQIVVNASLTRSTVNRIEVIRRAFEIDTASLLSRVIEDGVLAEFDRLMAEIDVLPNLDNDVIPWHDLDVHHGGEVFAMLGEVVDRADASLSTLTLRADGSILDWPGFRVAAVGEAPAWDTPRLPVDWRGLPEALHRAQAEAEAA